MQPPYYKVLLATLMSLLVSFEAKDSSSGFCIIDEVETSCAKQLWGSEALPNECIMWKPYNPNRTVPIRDSSECDAVDLGDDGFRTSTELIKVKLQAYYHSVNHHTAFNATFSEVKWEELKMRFKQNTKKDEIVLKNFCREFTITSNRPVPESSQLFYDCVWSTAEYEGKTYNFEYQARNGSYVTVGKYLFNVPNGTFISSDNKKPELSELFIYIDTTSLPVLKLRVQMARERYNVSAESYHVQVRHSYEDKFVKSVIVNLTRNESADDEDELTFEYDTKCDEGFYIFEAYINHAHYSGTPFISRSPIFNYSGDCGRKILIITIVGCGAIILSFVFFAFFIWRRRADAMNKQPPTLLMIYAATTTRHRLVAVELAKFLTNFCHVNALIDDLEIPKSKTKDPFTWCNNAFSQSKYVMILSSPFHKCNHYEGIYRRVDALGLRLVANNMGDRKSEREFFSVVLPYCTDKDVPVEAKNLRRFTLMKDLDKMLALLHSGSTSIVSEYCVEPLVYGGKSALKSNGQGLLNAVDLASKELAERKTDCNCSSLDHSNDLELGFVEIDINNEETPVFAMLEKEKDDRKDLKDFYPIHGQRINDLNLLGEGNKDDDDEDDKPTRNGFNINNLDL